MAAVTLIASGQNPADLAYLNNYDGYFAEGDYQELKINFLLPLAADVAGWFSQGLIDHGVTEWYAVTVSGSILTLRSRMGNPFPFLIVGAVLATLALVAIIGWELWRIVEIAPATATLLA
ncbi:MAG: hypothetical protein Q8R92_16685, partial [Deltaproteobacteria bacterium]|nr:hypothetical protein [Deltaproteobacteria bacterium]